jgi:hypothetical protein
MEGDTVAKKAASKGRAPAGGSNRETPRQLGDAPIVDAAGLVIPTPGWRVNYWPNGQGIGAPLPADVISVTGSQLNLSVLRISGAVPAENVYCRHDKRVVDNPKAAKTGVWDWMQGYEPERLYGDKLQPRPALLDGKKGGGAPSGGSTPPIKNAE